MKTKSWEARFRQYENKGDPDSCWNWTGTTVRGYGYLHVDGRKQLAHRLAFFLRHGHYPVHNAQHHCDNRRCVNPAHLYDGTQLENMRDRKAREHFASIPRGDRHYKAKLTEKDITDIRRSSERQVDLAKKFGISQPQVSRIKRSKTWKWV